MNASSFINSKVLRCRTFFFVSYSLISSAILGQSESSEAPVVGEALHYEVTYEWGPIFLEVGEVVFSAKEVKDAVTKQWDFRGWGTSKPHWDWFYPVNSTYSSTTDPAFIPFSFSRIGREGRHRYNRIYNRSSDHCMELNCSDDELDNHSICRTESGEEFRDVMSAIHWCRQLPWSSFERGEVIAMDLLLDGEINSTTLKFEGETKHLSPLWPDSVDCWEFHPTLIDGTVFKPGDEMKVLMTADHRRLPVYIETELIIGAAKIHLSHHQIHTPASFQMLRDSCSNIERNLDR